MREVTIDKMAVAQQPCCTKVRRQPNETMCDYLTRLCAFTLCLVAILFAVGFFVFELRRFVMCADGRAPDKCVMYTFYLAASLFLLAAALFCFAFSVAVDVLEPDGLNRHMLEDGAKFSGIVLWLIFFGGLGLESLSDDGIDAAGRTHKELPTAGPEDDAAVAERHRSSR